MTAQRLPQVGETWARSDRSLGYSAEVLAIDGIMVGWHSTDGGHYWDSLSIFLSSFTPPPPPLPEVPETQWVNVYPYGVAGGGRDRSECDSHALPDRIAIAEYRLHAVRRLDGGA
jgi:hypothetical protein